MRAKLESINIDPNILRIVAVTARDRMRRRITDGRVKHPKGKSKSGKHLLGAGHLKSGINYKIQGKKIIQHVTGPAKVYARILHEGGTIKPKTAKYLVIPLTPAAKVKKPRDFDDTFIKKGIIFRKKDNGKLEALYVLKKSVDIPAYDYFKLDESDMKIIITRVTNHIKKTYG
jgi:hypothetical protein